MDNACTAEKDPQQTRDTVGAMLVQRLRRWPNIEPTVSQCPVFAEKESHERNGSKKSANSHEDKRVV